MVANAILVLLLSNSARAPSTPWIAFLVAQVGLPDPTPAKASGQAHGGDTGVRRALRRVYTESPTQEGPLDPSAFPDDASDSQGQERSEGEETEGSEDGDDHDGSFDSDDDVSGLLGDGLRAAAAAPPLRSGGAPVSLRSVGPGAGVRTGAARVTSPGGGAGTGTAGATWGSMAAGDTDSGASDGEDDEEA